MTSDSGDVTSHQQAVSRDPIFEWAATGETWRRDTIAHISLGAFWGSHRNCQRVSWDQGIRKRCVCLDNWPGQGSVSALSIGKLWLETGEIYSVFVTFLQKWVLTHEDETEPI